MFRITLFLLLLNCTLFAQQGNYQIQIVMEVPAEVSSGKSLEYLEMIEKRLLYFGFRQSQVEVAERKNQLHIKLSDGDSPERIREFISGTGYFQILETIRFGDNAQMDQLFTLLEGLTMTNAGKSIALKDFLELNSTTIPGYDFRRFPPAVIGMVHKDHLTTVDQFLCLPRVQQALPPGTQFMWSQKPSRLFEGKHDLYLVRTGTAYADQQFLAQKTDIFKEANRFDRVRDIIDIWLDEEGTEILTKMTETNVGRELLIILDGEVISAPLVQGPIETGNLQIEGSFQGTETSALSWILRTPALPAAPVIISFESTLY